MTLPLSEQLRALVRQVKQKAQARHQAQIQCEQGFEQRRETIETSWQETCQRLASNLTQKQASLRRDFDVAQNRITQRFEEDHQRLTQEFTEAKHKAKKLFKAAHGKAEAQFKEKRWTITTLNEADKKVARDQFLEGQRSLKDNRAKLRAQYLQGQQLVRSWEFAAGLKFSLNKRPTLAPLDPWKVLEKRSQQARDCLFHLQVLALPKLLQGKLMPLGIFLTWLVLSLPAFFVKPWYLWLLGSTAIVLPAGWAMQRWMRGQARRQVAYLLQNLAQAAYDVQPLRRLCLEQARFMHKEQRRQSRNKHLADLRLAAQQYRQLRQTLVRRRRQQLRQAEEKYPPLLQQTVQKHERDQKTLQEKYRLAQLATQAQYDRELQAAEDQYHQTTEENNQRHQQEWQQLTEDWQNACAHFENTVRDIDQQCLQFFPTWEVVANHWQAPGPLPAGLPFGTLGLNPTLIPNSEPEDPRLARLNLNGLIFPALLPFPDRASLLFKATDVGRAQAIQAMQALLLRSWTSLPPGKLRCTIIDPVGRGENFAAFMHLADHDESLVNSRIWTESAHIDQRLTDMTAQMETVLQKFLRNQYQTLAEYNAHAGEVAEPFRLLVVAHFPVNFTTEAARRLISIAGAGARCGIYTLVMVDTKQPMPHGVQLADLESTCTTLVWRDGRFVWRDPDFSEFPLSLDGPPDNEICTRILAEVGERAKLANRVEVPFESIAPTPEEFWAADSRGGINLPLGRTGATARQMLALGKGTSQHVLIAGKTGSGKSTLLHVLITQLALRYSPDEIELYLIDFKKGVEFKTYASHQLPHARVVAVESEREFGLSVLQRLDAELVHRGEIFRKEGVNDLPSYRNKSRESRVESREPNEEVRVEGEERGKSFPALDSRLSSLDSFMPRILLIVDEFQEFFVEDDKTAQEAALLMDRLVRQGRAFGIHIILGSQTLGGAYSLARSTIDQMAVRIALQCSETDAHLILSKDNSEARLLSRPGEAIYNSANGMLEGNNLFQTVWLTDQRRDEFLDQARELARAHAWQPPSPLIVFEGATPSDLQKNPVLNQRQSTIGRPPVAGPITTWLGEAVAIKDPTAAIFRRQSGNNLLMVGQNPEVAFSLMVACLVSLAARRSGERRVETGEQKAESKDKDPHSSLPTPHSPLPALLVASTLEEETEILLNHLPEILPVRLVTQRDLPTLLTDLSAELDRRQKEPKDAEPIFFFVYGLQRVRDLRKPEDDFGFSRRGEDKPANPAKQFQNLLREGPPLGIFTIIWCDNTSNLQRSIDRQGMREFEMRILFQMNASDSSNLIDSPLAAKLGPVRALFYTEDQGKVEKFRPYGLPSLEWLRQLSLSPKIE